MVVKFVRLLLAICLTLLCTAWTGSPHPQPALPRQVNDAVQPVVIPLAGPIAQPNAEISGLGWYGDWLVLLPQFPHWFAPGDGAFFVLPKQQIVDFLDGRIAGPLTPQMLPLDAPAVRTSIQGFEGYESIAFVGDQVFVTVEADLGGPMLGWLLMGRIEPDLSMLHLSLASRVAIVPQAPFNNVSDEALVVHNTPDGLVVVTFYEANGRLSNPNPIAHRFSVTEDADLQPLASLKMPHVEYRVTDATALDDQKRFWISNYFWPGEVQILLGRYPSNPLVRRVLQQANLRPVERLVELQYSDDGIRFSETPPIELALLPGNVARNWEGIVRLDDRGFLLATDKFPETILAFVPLP